MSCSRTRRQRVDSSSLAREDPTDGLVTRPIGIEAFYFLDRWSDDQAVVFDRAAEAGYDGVEVSLVAGGEIDTRRIAAAAAAADVDILCSTGLTRDLDISSSMAEVRAAGIAHLIGCLEASAELRSPILGGVTYAPWMVFPDDDLDEHRKRSADSLNKVAIRAASLAVDLCLEVLNRFETPLFNTVADCLNYIDLVDHASVMVEVDTFHMNIEEDDLAAAVVLAGGRLGHVQVAANNRRPPQYGHIDWPPFRAALDAVGYQRWIVFETFPNPAAETGRATFSWRPLAVNLDLEAREAAAFIKGHLA